jgi:hypothetical protein
MQQKICPDICWIVISLMQCIGPDMDIQQFNTIN